MSTAKHLDLDALVPEPRTVTLKGRVLLVPDMPLESVLRLVKMKQELTDNSTQLEAVVDFISDLLQGANPDITREWLIAQLSVKQTAALVEFIANADSEDELGEASVAGETQLPLSG
jgi:predicted trehalose synthase